jgi:hypothetical protein
MDRMMQAFRAIKKDTATREAWIGLIVFMAVLTGLARLTIFSQWRQRQRKIFSPRKLFFEICRAHRLSWPERRLLWRLARSQKLEDPASLFLTPECFDISRLTVDVRAHAEELRRLRDRLFAAPEKKLNEIEESSISRTLSPEELLKLREAEEAIADSSELEIPKPAPESPKKRGAELPLPPTAPTLDLPQWNAGNMDRMEF